MANCNKHFLNFNTVIALTPEHKNILRTSRDAVREKIRNYFRDKENGFCPKFHGQGSFMMNTIIEPLDGEFDIDDGIYFQVKSEPSQTINTFHQWIYEAVNQHTKQEPTDKQTCIRLTYARKYHIDLPVYYIIEGQSPRLAHKTKGWIESDPREFIRWFNNNSDEKGQLKRIVRYLKAWSNYKKGNLPTGLILSILATNNIIYNESDDMALYETLIRIKNSLKNQFVCYRPTVPTQEDLLENYSQTKKDYFLDQLDSFIKSAEKALNRNTNEEDACKIWQNYFGERRFSCISCSNLSDNASNQQNITLCNKKLTTEKDKIFNESEEFIEDYHAIDLKYELHIDCNVIQDGYMMHKLKDMLRWKFPLFPEKNLEFFIVSCDAPKPFLVKWKIRNMGEEAIKRDCIRGEILEDFGNHKRNEKTNFKGPHFVECYIIKDNICVARSRIDVPISYNY